MPRTFLRQSTQIRNSDTYDDTLAAGVTLETAATHIEDDLNGLRSQVNRIIDDSLVGNWYDAIPTVTSLGASKTRSLLDLNTDLDALEEKRLLFRTQVLTDITVPAAQNFVILSVAGTEAPTLAAAVGTTTQSGAVVAFSAGFGAHALDEVLGVNAINPHNLCLVRDATTSEVITSSNGKTIYALLQSEIATNPHVINDINQRVQLSFVEENATGDDLVAVAVADIQGLTINYSYVQRLDLSSLPTDAYLSGVFVDLVASTDVTLDNAIDNQVGPATQTQNIDVQIDDGLSWDFQDSTGGTTLLSVAPAAGNDTVQFNVDTFDVNNATTADFLNGISVDTGGTPINLGVTAGQIDTGAGNDLFIEAGQELFFDDLNQTGSTWVQTDGIKLSEVTQDWDDFRTNFGEVSILEAFNLLSNASQRNKSTALVTVATIASGTDCNNTVNGNIDIDLLDYSTVTFVTDVDVYLNGVLMRNGANAAANHDVYPGTLATQGDIQFEFDLFQDDQITMIVYGS